MRVFTNYTLTKDSDELKKLILENPDLPIVVLVGEESNGGDYPWVFCSSISFGIDEILDCDYCDYDEDKPSTCTKIVPKRFNIRMLDDFDKTVFLTKAEAEKKLKEMES